mmetsp:Transcript_122092/g.237398  ORF Transcript_122092/g.237398 Transcript_122092/m.237398 type:complete len:80 (+) Transcript_122092:500-739(+)
MQDFTVSAELAYKEQLSENWALEVHDMLHGGLLCFCAQRCACRSGIHPDPADHSKNFDVSAKLASEKLEVHDKLHDGFL